MSNTLIRFIESDIPLSTIPPEFYSDELFEAAVEYDPTVIDIICAHAHISIAIPKARQMIEYVLMWQTAPIECRAIPAEIMTERIKDLLMRKNIYIAEMKPYMTRADYDQLSMWDPNSAIDIAHVISALDSNQFQHLFMRRICGWRIIFEFNTFMCRADDLAPIILAAESVANNTNPLLYLMIQLRHNINRAPFAQSDHALLEIGDDQLVAMIYLSTERQYIIYMAQFLQKYVKLTPDQIHIIVVDIMRLPAMTIDELIADFDLNKAPPHNMVIGDVLLQIYRDNFMYLLPDAERNYYFPFANYGTNIAGDNTMYRQNICAALKWNMNYVRTIKHMNPCDDIFCAAVRVLFDMRHHKLRVAMMTRLFNEISISPHNAGIIQSFEECHSLCEIGDPHQFANYIMTCVLNNSAIWNLFTPNARLQILRHNNI
jgi:hypothetical protein